VTARRLRPISRWISCVRPLCRPRAASRSVRVAVERGSMPYSAVTHLAGIPQKWRDALSTEAVHSTWVSPNSEARAFGIFGDTRLQRNRRHRIGRTSRRSHSLLRCRTGLINSHRAEVRRTGSNERSGRGKVRTFPVRTISEWRSAVAAIIASSVWIRLPAARANVIKPPLRSAIAASTGGCGFDSRSRLDQSKFETCRLVCGLPVLQPS